MSSTTWLLSALACALLNAWLAERKGYPVRAWFWLGALLGLLGTCILLAQPRKISHVAHRHDAR